MKKLYNYTTLLILAFISTSCISSDDDNLPTIVNQEEVITTVSLTLVPDSGTSIVLRSFDADGDGADSPIITVSGNLVANTTYTGSLLFLNETETPVDNITLEVQEEAEEHQVLYTIGSSLEATITYVDFDVNANPLGTSVSLSTASASQDILTVTLRHEPKKPNDGTLADAGGETDVQVSFPVVIE